MGNFLLTFAGDADGGGADGGDCHGVMVVMVEVLLMVVMVVLISLSQKIKKFEFQPGNLSMAVYMYE